MSTDTGDFSFGHLQSMTSAQLVSMVITNRDECTQLMQEVRELVQDTEKLCEHVLIRIDDLSEKLIKNGRQLELLARRLELDEMRLQAPYFSHREYKDHVTDPLADQGEDYHPLALMLFGSPPRSIGPPDLGLRKETPAEKRQRIRERRF